MILEEIDPSARMEDSRESQSENLSLQFHSAGKEMSSSKVESVAF
jgi:hypothetical protein